MVTLKVRNFNGDENEFLKNREETKSKNNNKKFKIIRKYIL